MALLVHIRLMARMPAISHAIVARMLPFLIMHITRFVRWAQEIVRFLAGFSACLFVETLLQSIHCEDGICPNLQHPQRQQTE
jgi:hypothetical protein